MTSIAGLLRSPMDYPQRNGPEEAQLLPEGLLLPNEAILESSRFVSLLWHLGHSCGFPICEKRTIFSNSFPQESQ